MAVYWPLNAGASSGYCRGRIFDGGVIVESVVPISASAPSDCVGTVNEESEGYPLRILHPPGSPYPTLVHYNGVSATVCRYSNARELDTALRPTKESETHSSSPVGRSHLFAHIQCVTQRRTLLALDILCGVALARCGAASPLAKVLDSYGAAVALHGENLTHFLMGAPADFKLNNAATSFYGTVILSIMSWLSSTRVAWLSVESLEIFVNLVLCTGVVCTAAMFVDLMRIFALPLLCVHRANGRLWKITHLTKTLFVFLFSKKYNILRKRYDSCETNYMQSALCSYLFVILAFLVPTLLASRVLFTLAYYAIFVVTIPPRMISSIQHVHPRTHSVASMDIVHDVSGMTIAEIRVKEGIDWSNLLMTWARYALPIREW